MKGSWTCYISVWCSKPLAWGSHILIVICAHELWIRRSRVGHCTWQNDIIVNFFIVIVLLGHFREHGGWLLWWWLISRPRTFTLHGGGRGPMWMFPPSTHPSAKPTTMPTPHHPHATSYACKCLFTGLFLCLNNLATPPTSATPPNDEANNYADLILPPHSPLCPVNVGLQGFFLFLNNVATLTTSHLTGPQHHQMIKSMTTLISYHPHIPSYTL